jgi:hypothetical protein
MTRPPPHVPFIFSPIGGAREDADGAPLVFFPSLPYRMGRVAS